MAAWRHWYHVSGTTYGTWLQGDPRGWRSRHHRTHVDGDYRNPPPAGTWDRLADYSAGRMKHPPLRLEAGQRRLVCLALAEKLTVLGTEPLVVSMDAVHFHLLARFVADNPRIVVGRVKRHATFELTAAGVARRAWAKGSHAKPIRSRRHQVAVFDYLVGHREKGAFVWTFRDGEVWREGRSEEGGEGAQEEA
jgi:hypothetical protein